MTILTAIDGEGPGRELLLAALLVSGAVAGVVNTIAGGGSFLTLPLLLLLGLPPSVANGTIRVGVLLQNVVACATFHRRGYRDHAIVLRLVLPVALGGAAGAWAATRIGDELLRSVFGYVFLGWAVLLVLRPGRFLASPAAPSSPTASTYLLAALIGAYGGLLQAGVGFPMIALLVMVLGYDPVRANAIKVALVLAFTGLALPVFARAGQVAWVEALVLAAGTMAGGWLGTRLQIRAGAGFVRWILAGMVAVSGLLMVL